MPINNNRQYSRLSHYIMKKRLIPLIKVLLVDGDIENIRNFKKFINASFPDFSVVGSINLPGDFMPSMKQLRPHLVLADIHVFSHLTVQLIREAYEFFPDTRFIIYGNYSDSDYMEKVMEYGVIDYMYRPVKPSELDKSLKRAAVVFREMDKLKKAHDSLVQNYKKNIIMFKDRFLYNLFQGHLTDEFEIANSMKYFDINITPEYTVFTVRIDHFKTVILTMDEMEKHLLVYQILSIVNEKLGSAGNGAAVINRLNSVSAVIGGSMDLFELISFCESIKNEVLYQTKHGVTIGVGRPYKNITDVCVSCSEAEAALRYRHIMGYNTVIPIDFVEPLNHITYKYPHEKEELLVYAAVAGEYNRCDYLLRQIISALKSSGELPERLVAKIIMNILISISRFASEQDINIESKFKTFFPSRKIFELQTLDEAYAFLSKSLSDFCEYMILLRNENKHKIALKVKEHIDEKYFENISLSKMAMHAKTTPEFLNSIFMEYEGKNIYDYAISVRLSKAKELIRSTSLEDDVIAVNVGYDDVKHFRSIFKQYEGVTTHEYRTKMKNI